MVRLPPQASALRRTLPLSHPHLVSADVLLEKLVTEFVEYDGALGPEMSDKLFKAAGEALDDIGLDLTHRCIQYVYGQRAEGNGQCLA